MPDEPGDRAPAPGPLRLVQRFVNTVDLEDGIEELGDAAALERWLRDAGLLGAGTRVDPADHRRAIDLREAIRALAAEHAAARHDPVARDVVDAAALHDPVARDVVDAAARRARLRPLLPPDRDGPTTLSPEAGGVDAALGRIVAAIHAAIAEGTWPRLKACERSVCSRAFYDRSKNRSGHWCSMTGCGAREKSRRAYRRRRTRRA